MAALRLGPVRGRRQPVVTHAVVLGQRVWQARAQRAAVDAGAEPERAGAAVVKAPGRRRRRRRRWRRRRGRRRWLGWAALDELTAGRSAARQLADLLDQGHERVRTAREQGGVPVGGG